MAEFSSFFNSLGGDRRYAADKFAEYFASFLTNGIYNGGTNLQPFTTGGDFHIRVPAGKGFIEGYYYSNDSEKVLTPGPADPSNARIDRVVLRLDLAMNNRWIRALVKTGTPAGVPAPPELERDLIGVGVYELSLAQVLIPAGASTIPAPNITDERLDSEVCGLVNSLIQADTTDIFNQFQNYLTHNVGIMDGEMEQFHLEVEDNKDEMLNIISMFQGWFTDTKNEYSAWYNSIKTAIFDAVYFDYTNWRYRAGHTYKTLFDTPNPGDIMEEIRNTVNNDLVASKHTEFNKPAAGQISETLTIEEDQVSVLKVTTFEEDGSIKEEIEEVSL